MQIEGIVWIKPDIFVDEIPSKSIACSPVPYHKYEATKNVLPLSAPEHFSLPYDWLNAAFH